MINNSRKLFLSFFLVLLLTLGLVSTAFANDLHEQQIGSSSLTFTQEGCVGDLQPGQVLWHFVHTDTTGADLPAFITVTFQDAGVVGPIAGYSNGSGKAIVMYNVITSADDILLGASDTIVNDGLLNLSHVCRAENTEASPLTTTKSAAGSFDKTFAWDISKGVNTTKIETADTASFNYTVTVSHDNGTDSNVKVNGNITVNNPNPAPVNIASLTDTLSDGTVCSVQTGLTLDLPSGDTTFSYACDLSALPTGDLTNTVSVGWAEQTLSDGSHLAAGQAAFTSAAINFAETDITDCVTVDDSQAGELGKVCVSDQNPTVFTYQKSFTDPAGTCTTHDNVATLLETNQSASQQVEVCVGSDLTVSKTVVPTFTRTYPWTLDKSVDSSEIKTSSSATFNYVIDVVKGQPVDSNWQATGDVTVSNPSDWEAISADLTDVVDNGGTCVLAQSTVTVPANASVTVGYSCSFASGASGINTATANWDQAAYSTPGSSASGTAAFDFETPTTVVNDAIDVIDSNGGSWHFTESGSVSYPMTFTDPAGTCTSHENIATIQQTGATDKVTVTVCVGADLTVSKTAVPSFTRNYTWSIDKAVDKTVVKQFGGTATFNYTVNVWQLGFTDSSWKVTGNITVNNPNDWEAISADLTDLVDNGGSCTLNQDSVLVPASGSTTVGYSCNFTSGASGINTATASWDKVAYATPTGSASGTASFAFTTPTTRLHKTITVTDTFNGSTTTLGTLTASDAAPFASASYHYPRTVAVPANNCVSYTNTAKIVETNQTSSQTVRVCGPAKTGALTMGFWQNTNGQGIIKAGASTLNVCNSATWLRQFAPFQDLSATATCTQTATYVYNIIKAANASGASMNAMLKAQMLATSLDVYFSNPALGGNKISALAPIGAVQIDLTKICTDLTCAAFENSSSVFGGTPKTVLEMLTYAASQSNVGGSNWYANVKTTQELAKDAFDAINNQKVFNP
jgi:hypothetical protein